MATSPLRAKRVVITGKIGNATRGQVRAQLIAAGAIPQDRITRDTDLLLVGERPGQSKLAMAKELDVPLISLTEASLEAIPIPQVAVARSTRYDDLLRAPRTHNIFVVHGQDEAARESVARFLERIAADGVGVTVLHEQINGGRTLIEKFESYAEAASYAVVLLTADDVGKAKDDPQLKLRARQNVVGEMFYFLAKLGRANLAVLIDPGVEKPTDIDGLVWIPLDGDWRRVLARELAGAGVPIDPIRAL